MDEIELREKVTFSPLTYLITNSMTRSFLTRPDGCISQSAFEHSLDWLENTGAKEATSSLAH